MAETIQELFVQGAERWASEHGERHGYSMLSAGLEHLLRSRGYDFGFDEVANLVHRYELSQFLDQGAKPETVDLALLARVYDGTWTRTVEPSWDLRSVLEGRATAGVGYRSLANLSWIEREVADTLKQRKIRRGTKKHVEFVEKNREKVRAAAKNVVLGDVKERRATIEDKLSRLNKDRDGWLGRIRGIERQLEFRRALLDATGQTADPRADKGANDFRNLYARAISALDSSIDYLQRQYAEADADVDQQVDEALRAYKDLAPFAGGRLCGC